MSFLKSIGVRWFSQLFSQEDDIEINSILKYLNKKGEKYIKLKYHDRGRHLRWFEVRTLREFSEFSIKNNFILKSYSKGKENIHHRFWVLPDDCGILSFSESFHRIKLHFFFILHPHPHSLHISQLHHTNVFSAWFCENTSRQCEKHFFRILNAPAVGKTSSSFRLIKSKKV